MKWHQRIYNANVIVKDLSVSDELNMNEFKACPSF